jgi:hypothetical protein
MAPFSQSGDRDEASVRLLPPIGQEDPHPS